MLTRRNKINSICISFFSNPGLEDFNKVHRAIRFVLFLVDKNEERKLIPSYKKRLFCGDLE